MKGNCKVLKEASIYIRKWIEKQNNVKEESLTDWLLYNISEKIDKIKYYSFTRNEEAKITGADWEWWFLLPKFAYRFRVQAKKVKDKDNYPSIAYSNKYGFQIEKLIEDSNKHNSYPIYAFYTDGIKETICNSNILDEGVYIRAAIELNKDILQQKRKKILKNDVLKNSIPLSCMLCCRLLCKNFYSFLLRYLVSTEEEKTIGQYEYSKLPRYLDDLIKEQYTSLPDWWEKEFFLNIEEVNVNGILIFNYREQDYNREI